jgi:REP element-mobilizing transposase RayT
MSNLDHRLFHRRHLPHYQPPGATLFVTFRLAKSIPAEPLRRLRDETEHREQKLASIPDPLERARAAYRLARRMFGKWDALLDNPASGPFWLRQDNIAQIIAASLRQRDGTIFDLHAYCIMPNHVHVVFQPLSTASGRQPALPAIMHSLKRFTAREANRRLGRAGGFWQHESYDHVVRDDDEWRRIVTYVIDNPVKAGLAHRREDWRWSYSRWGL